MQKHCKFILLILILILSSGRWLAVGLELREVRKSGNEDAVDLGTANQ